MIYQCYFRKDQESKLFTSDVYSGFGLEPEVNPDIALNCPELESAKNRLNLTEYAAFLHFYKNGINCKDDDWWIGFTSYRQLDKSPIIFHNKPLFEGILNKVANNFGGWGYYRTVSSAKGQADHCHPGLYSFMVDVFRDLKIDIPDRFYTDKHLLFANYWAMHKGLFMKYMDWSWPIIKHAMTLNDHPYTKTKSPIPSVSPDKWLGYFMERVFLVWYMRENLFPANLGPICSIVV